MRTSKVQSILTSPRIRTLIAVGLVVGCGSPEGNSTGPRGDMTAVDVTATPPASPNSLEVFSDITPLVAGQVNEAPVVSDTGEAPASDNTDYLVSAEEAARFLAEHNSKAIKYVEGAPLRINKSPSTFLLHYESNATVTQTIAHYGDHICNFIGFAGPLRDPAYFQIKLDTVPNIVVVKSGIGPESWVECTARTNFVPRAGSGNPLPWQGNATIGVGPGWTSYVAWPGFIAVVVNGVGSSFYRAEDVVHGVQVPWPSQDNLVGSKTVSGIGFVTPIVVQDPAHSGAIAFYGPFGKGTASGAGEFSRRVRNGESIHVALAPEDNMCYFTSIQGNIATGLDYAILTRVSPVGANHLLMSSSSGGDVQVRVRCVAINQNY